jgi:hypothetical protein
MDDHRRWIALDHADLKDDCGPVRADEHGEPVIEFEDPDRIALGVQHVLIGDAVLAGAVRDHRIDTHHPKLPCRTHITQVNL